MYPKLFGIIPMYPLMWLIGGVFLFLFMHLYFNKVQLKKGLITGIEIVSVLTVGFGVISALLFQNLYDFIENPSNYSWSWDMTFYGGLIGGVIFFYLLDRLWLQKQYGPHMKYLLNIMPSCICVMHGWGRIGCFFNGCCYGIESDSPLAMKFTTTSTKVLPTNLWEAIFLLTLATILFLLLHFKNFEFGFPVYLISYGTWRFIIEFFRGDDRGSFIPGLTPSQFWSILLFVGGIVYLIVLSVLKKKEKERSQEA